MENVLLILLILSAIHSIKLFYLLNKVNKLQNFIKPINSDKLKKIKLFYEKHYKTHDMREWSELSNEDIWKLSNTSEFLSYDLGLAKENFKNTFTKTFLGRKIQKTVDWLARLLA